VRQGEPARPDARHHRPASAAEGGFRTVKIAPQVHLVGSGDLGFGLTDPYDCHVYLVDGGREYALVDAGAGRAPAAILDEITADGLDASRVRWILITHGHADHAGGAAALRELCGVRTEVLVHRHWLSALGTGDEDAIGLTAARAAGGYPADYRLPPVQADGVLADGQTIRVGDVTLTAVETPGHSLGHVALWAEGPGLAALFAGDLVFPGGKIARLADSDLAAYPASLDRVAALRPQALFPGHERIVRNRAATHVAVAQAAFRAGRIPPSIV
jgi:hydroxyacylglutathione hydrolase